MVGHRDDRSRRQKKQNRRRRLLLKESNLQKTQNDRIEHSDWTFALISVTRG
jgi:hypothetical protein